MFKIAVDAGHYYNEPGRRCLKSVDPNETREWTMNSRVAEYFIEAAKQYKDVATLRVDDPTGKKEVTLAERVKKANEWGADLYLSFHHNAGINGGKGGGVVAFAYKNGGWAQKYRDSIYRYVIQKGKLVGDRISPKTTADFYVLRKTTMPAVLMEYGFMDSTTDIPVIITKQYSKTVAYATMEGVAEIAGIAKKKEETNMPTKDNTPADWAKDAVNWAVKKGIMKGDENGNYALHSTLTVERFLGFLYNYDQSKK